MQRINKEILLTIKDNLWIWICLLVQLIICFFGCIFLGYAKNDNTNQMEQVNEVHSDYQYNKIFDNLVGEYEKQFFANKDALIRLKRMYAMLKSREEFEYLELYTQSILLAGEELNKEFIDGYEQGGTVKGYMHFENKWYNEVKCLWISRNVLDNFNIKLKEGKFWGAEELDHKMMPVILGNNYKDIYQVGEIIDGFTVIDDEIKLRVVGILEEGAYVFYNASMLNLDRYILYPLKDDLTLPQNKDEYSQQKILYLFKTNGTLKSRCDADELQSIINEICETSGVLPISSIDGTSNSQSYIFYENTISVYQMFQWSLNGFIIFSVVVTFVYLILTIQKNQRYYAILLLNGYSFIEVKIIILGSTMFRIILADIVAILAYKIVGALIGISNYSMFILILVNVFLLIGSFLICQTSLKYTNLIKCLGEE